jgi:hypothetical protein
VFNCRPKHQQQVTRAGGRVRNLDSTLMVVCVFAMQHVEQAHEEQIYEDVGGQILFGL